MRAAGARAAGVAVREREAGGRRWRSTAASKRYDVNVPAALLHPGDNRDSPAVQERGRRRGRQARRRRGDRRWRSARRRRARRPARSHRSRARGRPWRHAPARAGRRAARARGCRSTCSCRRARTWRSPTARRRPGGTALVRVAVDGQPARTLHEGHRRRRLDRRARRPRRRRRAGGAHRSDRARHQGRPRLGRAARRRQGAAPRRRRDRRSPSSITSSSGWSTRCAPTSCTPTTRRRASRRPNYDAFAADATRFAWAQVPGTWSLPSHASLLTGVYPTVHRATAHEAKLSQGRALRRRGAEEGRLQDRRCSRRTATSRRSGASIAAGTSTATSSANRSPTASEYLWKTAKAWLTPDRRQEAVRVPRDHRAARRVHAAARSSWSSTGTRPTPGRSSRCCRACSSGSIKAGKLKVNDNDKKYLEALHDAEIIAERRRVRDVHRRPQDAGHLRQVGGDRRVRPRRPVLRARQRRPRRHRVPGAGARAR